MIDMNLEYLNLSKYDNRVYPVAQVNETRNLIELFIELEFY